MRGAIVMTMVVMLAVLALHYVRAVKDAHEAESDRSDPLVAFDNTQFDFDDESEAGVGAAPLSTATADDFAK